MRFELFIALRYLFSLRKNSFISIISLMSVLGVGLGVASLIVVLGVMSGFSNDLREKILGVNAHLIVLSVNGGLTETAELTEKVASVNGVTGVTPFIYSEVMASTPAGVKGVVLRGIDPESASEVLSLPDDMIKGSLESLNAPEGAMPRIIVGEDMALRLNLVIGSRVNLLSPTGETSAAGFSPKVSVFEVCGVFKTGMFEYDASLAFVTLQAAKDLLGFKDILATGLEARVDDIYRADIIAREMTDLLKMPFYVRNWKDMNANLFAALELEKTAMFIILIMIVLVGSFSIITTLVMLVMEKTKDIAILRSMGARRIHIRKIFIFQGLVIGSIGTTIGFALGVGTNLLLKKYQFIKLPEDVYSMSHLPVRMEGLDLAVICGSALLLCFLATLYPAWKAARLDPAEALRFE